MRGTYEFRGSGTRGPECPPVRPDVLSVAPGERAVPGTGYPPFPSETPVTGRGARAPRGHRDAVAPLPPR